MVKPFAVIAFGLGLLTLGGCASASRFEMPRFKPCGDLAIGLYFESLSSEISTEARAALKGAARQTRGCHVTGIEVLGLADPVGAMDANQTLSEDRALAVEAALRGLGLTGMTLKAAGEAGAVTPGGAVTPLRRRVEVILHMTQRQGPLQP